MKKSASTNTKIKSLVNTEVRVTPIDSSGRKLGTKIFRNEITKEGASIIAGLLVNPGAPRPSHIYGRFGTNGNPAPCENGTNFSNPLTYGDVSYVDFASSASTAVGAIREPLFGDSKIENNGSVAGGKITFFFRLTGSGEVAGTFNNASSEIYYLGIAASRDLSDASRDLVFSVLSAHDTINGLSIPAGGQIAIDYILNLDP